MRRVVALEEAVQDLEIARDFYDSSELGIGTYCVDSLLADLESLALFHGVHRKHFGCHRMLATHFPFGIYYIETSHETQVVCILDLRRHPNWIRMELEKRSSEPAKAHLRKRRRT